VDIPVLEVGVVQNLGADPFTKVARATGPVCWITNAELLQDRPPTTGDGLTIQSQDPVECLCSPPTQLRPLGLLWLGGTGPRSVVFRCR